MSNIAFLGLGQMGAPMAERLVRAGHEVTVWNRSPQGAERLAALGARVAPTPAAAASGAQIAITMLATPDALESVLFGPDGLGPSLRPGQLLVEMSTVGPAVFTRVAERVPSGVVAVDAPVRGSVPEATEGRLHVYVGADDEVFERVRPVLVELGPVHHVGPAGSGAAMKLVVNATLLTAMAALGEALALGSSLGLDRTTVLDVLEESPVGGVVRAKRARIETGEYPPDFKLALAAKDIRLADEVAASAARELGVVDAVRAWFDEAEEHGMGDLDFSAVVQTITATA